MPDPRWGGAPLVGPEGKIEGSGHPGLPVVFGQEEADPAAAVEYPVVVMGLVLVVDGLPADALVHPLCGALYETVHRMGALDCGLHLVSSLSG